MVRYVFIFFAIASVWFVGCSGVSTSGEQATQRGSATTQQHAARATHATHHTTEQPADKGGVAVVEPPPADEPTYQGIPMSKWVRALKDKDKKLVEQAVKALVAIGEPAEEALYQAYETRQVPASAAVSTHYYSKGERGVPFFARAVRDKNQRTSSQAASMLVFLHERFKCLPTGSELRKDVEKALQVGRQSQDPTEKRHSEEALNSLSKLP